MTVNDIMNANMAEVRQVINALPNEFDSHDFIQKFSKRLELDYVYLLATSGVANPFQVVHLKIGKFLSSKQNILGIRYLEKVNSENIFGEKTECALWEKY